MTSVAGKVWDDFKNQPIQNLEMYVYKPSSLYGGEAKIMAQATTDSYGNYSMSFESGQNTYLVSFKDPNSLYIFDSNNSEQFLNKGFNKKDFYIRKAKIFKTNIKITNNIYGKMSIYGAYAAKSQLIPLTTTDTILYFNADPKDPNIFQMYVREKDGHYWWKKEVKQFQGFNDTLNIRIDADINGFKRYAASQNPGS
jgi:hypothetical protein